MGRHTPRNLPPGEVRFADRHMRPNLFWLFNTVNYMFLKFGNGCISISGQTGICWSGQMSTFEYICVDLDGTLVRNDLFLEAMLRLIKQNPLNLIRIALWLLAGRASAKQRVAERTPANPETLSYNEDLLSYLTKQKAAGKTLVLATASHELHARRVADHLGLFDAVIATRGDSNMKGIRKLAAILDLVGDKAFAYAGDSPADRPLWRESAANILVNALPEDIAEARGSGKAELVIGRRPGAFVSFVREMRPYQYTKNMLLFVPLLTAHKYLDTPALTACVLALIAFSLCASGVYFLNDLLDLEADRAHVRKQNRPLASGALPIPLGVAGAVLLPLFALVLAYVALPWSFFLTTLAYYLITNAYSFFLKRIPTADVMTLSILYTLRIIAGGTATGIEISFWLLAFSIFVFVSLAYLKRYIEVASLPKHGKAHGRDYSAADSETMFGLGIANITASVVILALYINTEEVASMYRSPALLGLLCLLMLFWGNRVWVSARRGEINDDPILYALKDKVSWGVVAGFALVVLAAKHLNL